MGHVYYVFDISIHNLHTGTPLTVVKREACLAQLTALF